MKLARIHSFIFSQRETAALKLQNQAYVLIIPQKLLEGVGFFESEIKFDLVFEDGVPSLLGRTSSGELWSYTAGVNYRPHANLIVRPRVYERYRRAARHGVVILARGRLERQGDVVHLMVHAMESADWAMAELAARSRDFH